MKKLLFVLALLSAPVMAQQGDVVLRGTGGWKALCKVSDLQVVSADALNPTIMPSGDAVLFINCINTIKSGWQEEWANYIRLHSGIPATFPQ